MFVDILHERINLSSCVKLKFLEKKNSHREEWEVPDCGGGGTLFSEFSNFETTNKILNNITIFLWVLGLPDRVAMYVSRTYGLQNFLHNILMNFGHILSKVKILDFRVKNFKFCDFVKFWILGDFKKIVKTILKYHKFYRGFRFGAQWRLPFGAQLWLPLHADDRRVQERPPFAVHVKWFFVCVFIFHDCFHPIYNIFGLGNFWEITIVFCGRRGRKFQPWFRYNNFVFGGPNFVQILWFWCRWKAEIEIYPNWWLDFGERC